MKLLALSALLFTSASFAQVTLQNEPLGSGTPGQTTPEVAVYVMDGMSHVPQYMPMYPTAATIWPRVIEVPCKKEGIGIKCEGYTWRPEYGRAEYLFVKPVLVEPVQAEVKTVQVPYPVYVEVPAKKLKE